MGEGVKAKPLAWPPSKALLIAFTPLLLLLATVPKLYSVFQRKQIRKDPVMTVGTLSHFESVRTRYRHFYRAEVRFWVDGQSYVGKTRSFHTLTDQQLHDLLGQKLPILYEKSEPSNSVVLSTEEQFGHFEFHFPDSLRWTKSYFY
ncbi:hypothetical protein GCM10027299_12670 [Larkinella ripae]